MIAQLDYFRIADNPGVHRLLGEPTQPSAHTSWQINREQTRSFIDPWALLPFPAIITAPAPTRRRSCRVCGRGQFKSVEAAVFVIKPALFP